MADTARWAAARRKQLTYLSARPCAAGHRGPRYVTSGRCVECTKRQAEDVRVAKLPPGKALKRQLRMARRPVAAE